MASLRAASESEEEFHSMSGQSPENDDDVRDEDEEEEEEEGMEPPSHPVAALQKAFEESIRESTETGDRPKSLDASAESRRQKVLEAGNYDDSWMTRWKQKPSAQHHPLMKLMAQIVFGMHLLQQQAAKSDAEVVKILQMHVDEVDNFLEKTTEDFDLAIKDVEERIKFLKLPMTHRDVFETMLDDKAFRTQLLDGNDKIEKIIDRTARAMNAALLDVQKGKLATKELGLYLDSVKSEWPNEKQDLESIFSAMRGNEQGWKHCLKDLQKKGISLKDSLSRLATVIGEMSKLAASASRRQRQQSRPRSSGQDSTTTSIPRSKFSSDAPKPSETPKPISTHKPRTMSVTDKPLPREPEAIGGAVQLAITTKPHAVPMSERYESPRPTPKNPSRSERASTVPPRPKTSGSMAAREARSSSRSNTSDLANFLKESGPNGSAKNGVQRSNTVDLAELLKESEPSKRSHQNGELADRASVRSASTTVIRSGRTSTVDIGQHTRASSQLPPRRRPQTATPKSSSQRRASEAAAHAPLRSTSQEPLPNLAELPVSKRESFSNTRFGRRLSIRKKHLPSPDQSQQVSKDSTSSPETTNGSDTPKRVSPTDSKLLAPISEAQIQPGTPQRRATSPRLGIFPSTEPLTPSAVSVRSASNPQPQEQSQQPDGASPATSRPDAGKYPAANGTSGEPNGGPPVRSNTDRPNMGAKNGGKAKEKEKEKGKEKPKKERAFSLRRMFGQRQPHPNRAMMTYGDLA